MHASSTLGLAFVALEIVPQEPSYGVIGTSPYSYQWFREEQPVPAATNSTHTVPHALRAIIAKRHKTQIQLRERIEL
jgi:hypothetical protein